MARDIRHPGWRDELESIRFPFDQLASLEGDNGEFIPAEVFVDGVLYPIGADDILYLSRVTISASEAEFAIGTETTPELATGTIDLLDPPQQITFADQYGRPAGILVANATTLGLFQAWSQGPHLFSIDQTRFSASVCVPLPDPGVRGILLDDGTILSDEVWFVGDNGVVLTPSEETIDGVVTQVIRVDVVGDPLFRRQLCAPVFQTPQFVQSVTFRQGCQQFTCGPGDAGVVKIMVGSRFGSGTVLRVTSAGSRLTFEAVGELMRPE